MKELTVIAVVRAKSAHQATLLREWKKAAIESRQEPGCISYELLQNTADAQTIISVERWRSKDALDQHFKTPYIQALLEKVPAWVDGAPSIQVYSEMDV